MNPRAAIHEPTSPSPTRYQVPLAHPPARDHAHAEEIPAQDIGEPGEFLPALVEAYDPELFKEIRSDDGNDEGENIGAKEGEISDVDDVPERGIEAKPAPLENKPEDRSKHNPGKDC